MDDDLKPFEITLSGIQACLDAQQKPFAISKQRLLNEFQMLHDPRYTQIEALDHQSVKDVLAVSLRAHIIETEDSYIFTPSLLTVDEPEALVSLGPDELGVLASWARHCKYAILNGAKSAAKQRYYAAKWPKKWVYDHLVVLLSSLDRFYKYSNPYEEDCNNLIRSLRRVESEYLPRYKRMPCALSDEEKDVTEIVHLLLDMKEQARGSDGWLYWCVESYIEYQLEDYSDIPLLAERMDRRLHADFEITIEEIRTLLKLHCDAMIESFDRSEYFHYRKE